VDPTGVVTPCVHRKRVTRARRGHLRRPSLGASESAHRTERSEQDHGRFTDVASRYPEQDDARSDIWRCAEAGQRPPGVRLQACTSPISASSMFRLQRGARDLRSLGATFTGHYGMIGAPVNLGPEREWFGLKRVQVKSRGTAIGSWREPAPIAAGADEGRRPAFVDRSHQSRGPPRLDRASHAASSRSGSVGLNDPHS
jgi:hypothetical protein